MNDEEVEKLITELYKNNYKSLFVLDSLDLTYFEDYLNEYEKN